MRRVLTTTVFLCVVLMSMVAAVSPEATKSAIDSQMPVAIAQPLAAMNGAPLAAVSRQQGAAPLLPEPGLMVLVGSALLGLGSLVRRNTKE
jgi:hypothetical protein